MQIKKCSIEDIPLLAQMNQWLIEDEKSDTKLTLPQLEERMTNFITTEYTAYLFYKNEKVVGYALCDISRTPIYLRQFFICREERQKGYGRQAINKLLLYLNTHEVDIDVYHWNKKGIAFWESIGFAKRCYNMRYSNKKGKKSND